MQKYSFTNVLEYMPKKFVGLSSKQMQAELMTECMWDDNPGMYM